jgi:acetyl-CoA synthetase (ADP-forming)/acetyltransferase
MDLKRLFYPESIAVVGASPNFGGGKMPYYQVLKGIGYQGRLYPVNPKYIELNGAKVYASLDDLPEPVDLAIVSVPVKRALETIKAAARKGIRYVHFFTAGFGEIGEKELEAEMMQARGNTRILGPNCLGVHCTASRIIFDPSFHQTEDGKAAFLGQSGGITSNFVRMAQSRYIPINKVVSYGNQIDLRVEDFIAYLGRDDTVSVIAAYIEDIKDGLGFMNALKLATLKKPVVILKGGITEQGARAAASHTGAIAGAHNIWSAVMRQHRCIQVDTFEQLLNVVMLATSEKIPTGPRLGFLGAGGGTSVLFTDLAHLNGLSLPELNAATQAGIAKRISKINTCTMNPVDLGAYGFDFTIMAHTMQLMDRDENIDVIIPYFSLDFISIFQNAQIESGPHTIVEAAKHLRKPVIPIFSRFTEDDLHLEDVRIKIFSILRKAGLPVYNTIQDCIHSIREMLQWSLKPQDDSASCRMSQMSEQA